MDSNALFTLIPKSTRFPSPQIPLIVRRIKYTSYPLYRYHLIQTKSVVMIRSTRKQQPNRCRYPRNSPPRSNSHRSTSTQSKPGRSKLRHTTQQSSRVLESKDDSDASFSITTIPILASIPFIDPQTNPLPDSIITGDNTTPLSRSPPNTTPQTSFIQHSQNSGHTHLSTRSSTFHYNVSLDTAEVQSQLNVRAKHTYITHDPTVKTDPTKPETQESFILPIIRVGPTAFGLMQLCHSTPRAVHLRMLGGSLSQPLGASIENAMIATDNQTNNLFQRSLHNLRRFVKSDFDQDYMIQLTEANNLIVTNVAEFVGKMTEHDPTFLDLRYNKTRPLFNSVFDTRTPPIGKGRKALYHERVGPSTFGRVIASQINDTPYPIDQPHHLTGDFINLMSKPFPKYPQPGVPIVHDNNTLANNTSAIHLLDLGQLTPDGPSPNLLDPAQMPNFKSQLVYPNLFSSLNATPELKNIATLLFSGSSCELQTVSKAVALKQLSKRYNTTPEDLDKIITPSPLSHAPFLATVTALSTHYPPIQSTLLPEQISDILANTHNDKEGLFKFIFSPKYSDIESLDPRLLLWLLPIIFHYDKPGPIQASSTGPVLDYTDFTTTERPLPWFQSTSLHWVPLNEITNQDHRLAPRFNRNHEVAAVSGPDRQKTTASQHFQQISSVYGAHRPDLVKAHKAWSKYIVDLSRPERELLAAASGQNINAAAINDVGQLLTTSTGAIFPSRQSHLNVLQTPEMIAYLNSIITKSRSEAFDKIPGGEQKILKRFVKYPQIARHCGYNHNEVASLLGGFTNVQQ